VALSRLSIANTFYNITAENNKIEWFEVRLDANGVDTNSGHFTATIEPGFYSAAALSVLVQTAMNNTQNRAFVSETPMTFVFSLETVATGFRTSITGSATTGNVRDWALSADTSKFQNTIWDLLGFEPTQVINGTTFVRAVRYYGIIKTGNVNIADRNLKAIRTARETYPFIQLHSNTLASNSRELTNDANVHTRPSKRLGIVPVNVNRYSWIHFQVENNFEWHDLSGTISKFDLKLCNNAGVQFGDDEFPDYHCTLIFETDDHTERNYEKEALAKLGYIKAHCR
jgi:hypothetical protein